MTQSYKVCPKCDQAATLDTAFCGQCGHRFRTQFLNRTQIFVPPPTAMPLNLGTEQKSKVAAALFAFFLGGLGAHGFYLGNTMMGVTLLVVWVLSLPLVLIGVGIFTLVAVHIICLIQVILYSSASDYDFQQKYVLRKQWF